MRPSRAPSSGSSIGCGSGCGTTFSEVSQPSLHYSPVTRTHTVTTRRSRTGTISGAIRVQYSFLIPTYPPGTFVIYSCLGTTKFKARAVG